MVLSAAVQAAEAAASSGQRLDLEFAQTMRSIDRALKAVRIDRHVRIRGEQWAQRLALLAKLRQPLFQKDRNLHADLLLKCIQEGHWTEPMDKHPPDGPLPSLPQHVACMLRRQRQERSMSWSRGGFTDGYPSKEAPNFGSFAPGHGAQSLAHAAAAAVSVPMSMASAPPAYTALAARLTYLEEQNRQLRRQLDAEKRRESGRGRAEQAERSLERSRRPSPSLSPSPARRAARGGVQTARPEVSLAESADTEAFMKYLDVFQAQARSLLRQSTVL
ncbi:unnamed protein product [Durusdinium trenchii]|uniref:Uncharacterized protein n=2 Tax=Durusdinium trenchii TaxID=1381693 RepID=A0ABP0PDQ9_9DINO